MQHTDDITHRHTTHILTGIQHTHTYTHRHIYSHTHAPYNIHIQHIYILTQIYTTHTCSHVYIDTYTHTQMHHTYDTHVSPLPSILSILRALEHLLLRRRWPPGTLARIRCRFLGGWSIQKAWSHALPQPVVVHLRLPSLSQPGWGHNSGPDHRALSCRKCSQPATIAGNAECLGWPCVAHTS